jgi:hypothetical protein
MVKEAGFAPRIQIRLFSNRRNRLLPVVFVHCSGEDFLWLVQGEWVKKRFSATPVVRPLLFY